MQGQADLFLGVVETAPPVRKSAAPRIPVRQQGQKRPFRLNPADFEPAVDALEASGQYRVLRRLQPRPIVAARVAVPGERIAVIVDTETTGLDHTRDEVIEIGMVAFSYHEDGRIGDVVGTYNALREPTMPITPEITRLTGITSEMVKGHAIDLDAVEAFIQPAHLVIAHNARFDRPFCERLADSFSLKAWACSHAEVSWSDFGFEGSKLGYLLSQCGWFHQGHRAVEDCYALLEVLASPLRGDAHCAMSHLLASARKALLRIWAEGAPFDMKDALKKRGYRWNDGTNGRPKSWFIEIDEDAYGAEMKFLRQEIYRRDVEPFTQRITAFERFRPVP
ncbi:3'-5' exonuclease [Microvirga lotononidis]|uniref:DNA polymerase III epsilon subunit-like 3'-5' exonuclease n=1 Tax=Microvirga lotononidis TaxID=864069 RepID=I4YWW3_9HYPH|nr:3'-5' exonuclease [Microvirga lotononidis]EIM28455.1 DNA polymerase III epsilon subunit-like 3'-5' exonuclease [Microvirga lotononidis]WQO27467.1 3'-5' exonuclease [Microvirga lotononidis]